MSKKLQQFGLIGLTVAALIVSCAGPQPTQQVGKTALVWPAPPDEPRLNYVKSIGSPEDLGISPSMWKRVGRFFTGESAERQRLLNPFAVALDETGNLCVTDTANHTVCYCDFIHKQWRRWEGVGKTNFLAPVALARRNGIFYVADSELGRVLAFGEDGKEVFTISRPLLRPVGLTLAGDLLVVADSQAHTLFVFDLRGQLQFQFGQRGDGPGEFNFPTHVAADQAGHLLVTDSLNSRIQVFDLHGKFLSSFGGPGDTSGHFGRPKGVATDSFGHVYVVDAVFNNLQIFDLSGRLLLTIGGAGSGPGEFNLPAGIAIGADNLIYVADCYNRRVQVFKYVGQP